MRFFWILSDNKTVRELSREEYFKMVHRNNGRLLCWVDKTDILLVKNQDIISLRSALLAEVLAMAEVEK